MFLHVDLDAFFASVEQLDNPELRGKPVIVGAMPGSKRGVVAAASYEARQFGVHSAMPIDRAYRLCPQGIYLRSNMARYREKSQEVMAIFAEFSPDVQQMSIDEAFIDLTGTQRLFGPPEETAMAVKRRVLEATGLTVSVGLASNRYVAKIASGMSKPDGFFYVPPGQEQAFMETLPLHKVWGVGEKLLERLKSHGIHTVSEALALPLPTLERFLGHASAQFLYNALRGMEAATFRDAPQSRSISAENTYEDDLVDRYTIGTALMDLCQNVMFRLMKEDWKSRTVCVKIRYNDFTTTSIQETGPRYIASADDLFQRASTLFDKRFNGRGVRLLGVGAMNLEPGQEPLQTELFDFGQERHHKLEEVVLQLKAKNPNLPLTKARLLRKSSKANASEKGED